MPVARVGHTYATLTGPPVGFTGVGSCYALWGFAGQEA
jgi:hypothetical protein